MKLFADVFQQSLGKLRKKEEDGSKRLFRANQRTSPKVDVGEEEGLFSSSSFSYPSPFLFSSRTESFLSCPRPRRLEDESCRGYGTDRRKVRGKKEGGRVGNKEDPRRKELEEGDADGFDRARFIRFD